jgi:hypothetical protein
VRLPRGNDMQWHGAHPMRDQTATADPRARRACFTGSRRWIYKLSAGVFPLARWSVPVVSS